MKLLLTYVLAVGLIAAAVQEEANAEICVFEKLDPEDSKICKGNLEVSYPELGDVGCTYIPNCYEYRKQISREWSSPNIRYNQADKNKRYVLIMVDPDAPSRARPKYRYWRHWVVVDIMAHHAEHLDGCSLNTQILVDQERNNSGDTTVQHRNGCFSCAVAHSGVPSGLTGNSLRVRFPLGADLKNGKLQGRVLADYLRPTPPAQTGYHRYQFLLFEQPAREAISLSPEEAASSGDNHLAEEQQPSSRSGRHRPHCRHRKMPDKQWLLLPGTALTKSRRAPT